ncbi:MAG: SDR family NAD(P)-dependent oxidoreductase [Jatrophihabitans sp.]
MHVADARILVTGATGGIGQATARRLHARGARLVLHGRDPDRLTTLASSLDASVVAGDLTAIDGPARIARDAEFVDVLVHCAGVGLRGAFATADPDQLDRLIALNLRAPVQLARALLPKMCAARRGHLAFVASIAGFTAVPHEAVYAATKAGVLALADSLALELAGTGVGVSTISPGAVATGFWDARGVPYHRSVPRPISAGRVADALVRDIESGGGDRIVPGWLGVAPRVRALSPGLYRRLARRLDQS